MDRKVNYPTMTLFVSHRKSATVGLDTCALQLPYVDRAYSYRKPAQVVETAVDARLSRNGDRCPRFAPGDALEFFLPALAIARRAAAAAVAAAAVADAAVLAARRRPRRTPPRVAGGR